MIAQRIASGASKQIRRADESARWCWWTRAAWRLAIPLSRTSICASIAAPARPPAPRASNTASSSKPPALRSNKTITGRFLHACARSCLSHLLPYPRRIAAAARFLRLYQRSGLETVARGSGVLAPAGPCRPGTPDAPGRAGIFLLATWRTFPAQGPRRARVALFRRLYHAGDLRSLIGHHPRAAREWLRGCRAGRTNLLRRACSPCGSARRGARTGAREFRCFLANDFDAIVTNAAGCGSTLKEYHASFRRGSARITSTARTSRARCAT